MQITKIVDDMLILVMGCQGKIQLTVNGGHFIRNTTTTQGRALSYVLLNLLIRFPPSSYLCAYIYVYILKVYISKAYTHSQIHTHMHRDKGINVYL